MDTWQLIKAILHGTNFYWRKFFVFLLFALAIGGAVFYIKNNKSSAEFQFAEGPRYVSVEEQDINIDIKENGQVLIDGKNSSKSLKLYRDYDEVSMILLDNPGVYFGSLRAVMNLPKAVEKDQFEQIIYAIHGVESYRTYQSTPDTLVYEVEGISPTATLSIAGRFKDKTMVDPPINKKIGYFITNLPLSFYFILSGAIPVIAFSLMLFMVLHRRRDQILSLNIKPLNQLPGNVSPAVAGVLLDGQVGERELSAILIDLANRGFIFITRKDKNFSFGRRKGKDYANAPDLKTFEKVLLDKIFLATDYKSTRNDVEMRVGRHIFSRKIAMIYLEIYNEATNAGYFVKNPAAVHRSWRNWGIFFFLFSILGYIYAAVYSPDPKFTLFFWAGAILASSVIIRLSSLMPARSSYGSKALNQWMAFRKYLKAHQPIEAGANIANIYIKYLPYAIVFGVEAEWTRRFQNQTFAKPEWYESKETITTLSEFANGLFPLIGFVGQILAKSHEPTVE